MRSMDLYRWAGLSGEFEEFPRNFINELENANLPDQIYISSVKIERVDLHVRIGHDPLEIGSHIFG